MAAMSGNCMCARAQRLGNSFFCGRCFKPIRAITTITYIATDAGAHGQPNPLSADAPPVPTAGAGRPSTPAPAASSPWDTDDDDYTEAFGNTDGLRIRAAFEKRTGRP
jgi:hypothetical protein